MYAAILPKGWVCRCTQNLQIKYCGILRGGSNAKALANVQEQWTQSGLSILNCIKLWGHAVGGATGLIPPMELIYFNLIYRPAHVARDGGWTFWKLVCFMRQSTHG